MPATVLADVAALAPTESVGKRYEILITPRLDIVVAPWAESMIRGVVNTVFAGSLDYELEDLSFPIQAVDGRNMKIVRIVAKKVTPAHFESSLGLGLQVIISALVGALAWAFIVYSVRELGRGLQDVKESGFGIFLILIAAAAGLYVYSYRKI